MGKRGRPIRSEVRQNIVEIVHHLGSAYGYQITKAYSDIFKKIDSELVYYHLKKGLSTGEFELGEVKVEKGDYSWGKSVEKSYYKLGPKASPRFDRKVKEYFDTKK